MLWSVCYPVAERISAERGEAIGDTVGYKVLTNCYTFLWYISWLRFYFGQLQGYCEMLKENSAFLEVLPTFHGHVFLYELYTFLCKQFSLLIAFHVVWDFPSLHLLYLSWICVSCTYCAHKLCTICQFFLSYAIFCFHCRYVWSQKVGRIHQSYSVQMVFFWDYW